MEPSINISLASEVIGHVGPIPVRNTMLMAWLVVLVMIGFCTAVRATGYKLIPGRFQMLIEIIVDGLYGLFAPIFGEDSLTRKFFPLISTIFLFIVLGNWMGILPGIGTITILGMHEGHETAIPLFRSMNADVNMTLMIALIAMFSVQFYGVKELGLFTYGGKFFVAPWKDPIHTFVGLLELIGEMSKVISFTFRLFGNIFAGEVLLIVISYLAPYLAPIPFLGMELFVGLVQGLVFALLTTVFLKIAVAKHEAHHDDAPHAPEPAMA